MPKYGPRYAQIGSQIGPRPRFNGHISVQPGLESPYRDPEENHHSAHFGQNRPVSAQNEAQRAQISVQPGPRKAQFRAHYEAEENCTTAQILGLKWPHKIRAQIGSKRGQAYGPKLVPEKPKSMGPI